MSTVVTSQERWAEMMRANPQRVARFRAVPFSPDVFGGWDGFADLLADEYCHRPSAVNLGFVCPQCTGLAMTVAHGCHPQTGRCPTCHNDMVPFWSRARTRHHFSTKPTSLGVVACRQQTPCGLLWGYPKAIPALDLDGFSIDMVLIPRAQRRRPDAVYAVGVALQSLLQALSERGLPVVFSRTTADAEAVRHLFTIGGFTEIGPCPEDPRRRIYARRVPAAAPTTADLCGPGSHNASAVAQQPLTASDCDQT